MNALEFLLLCFNKRKYHQCRTNVAVITLIESSFDLDNIIQSVKSQTYPCKHYIFINGEKFYKNISETLRKFENLTVIYKSINMNELISILVKEERLFYLNEGSFDSPTYIENRISQP